MAQTLALIQQLGNLEQQASARPIMIQDESGAFHIRSIDEVFTIIDSAIESAKNMDFTEDDMAQLKSSRAINNKLAKNISRVVIDHKRDLFDDIDQERKELSDRVNTLNDVLNESIDEFVRRQRENKRDELRAVFNDSIHFMNEDVSDDFGLTSISFELIEDRSWANKSTSKKAATDAMNQRLNDVVNLGSMDEFNTARDVVNALDYHDWSVSSVIQQLNEERATREAEEKRKKEEEERRRREIAEAEERGRREALAEADKTSHENDTAIDEGNGASSAKNNTIDTERNAITQEFSFVVNGTSRDQMNKLRDSLTAFIHDECERLDLTLKSINM